MLTLNTPRGYTYASMKYLGTLLFIVYIGLSVFGIFGMHAMMQNQNGDCIAATVQDKDCPYQVGSFDYLIFHINAYKNFSLAIFSGDILSSLFTVFSLFLLVGLILFNFFVIKFPRFTISKQKYRYRNSFLSHQKQKINQWLAMLENSPAVISWASI